MNFLLFILDEERQKRFLGLPDLPGPIVNPKFGLSNLRGGNTNPLGSH